MLSAQNERVAHFLNLLHNASVEETRQICVDATSDAQLFVFSELLNAPQIMAMQNTPDKKYYSLVCLFAHGTVADYQKNAGDLPALSEAQWSKLRLLSLVSLAYGRSRLPYSIIREHLDLEDDVQVEQVLRDAAYAGLVRGRMDQRDRSIEISSSVGRDVVAPEGVQQMIELLRSVVLRSSQLVEEIDKKIGFIGEQTAIASACKSTAAASAERIRNSVLHDTERRDGSGCAAHFSEINDLQMADRLQNSSRRHLSRRALRSQFNN